MRSVFTRRTQNTWKMTGLTFAAEFRGSSNREKAPGKSKKRPRNVGSPSFCQVTTFPPSHRPSIGETRYPAGKPGFFFNFWTTLQLSREYADVLARLALPKEPSRQSRTHRIVPRWHFPRKNPRATFQGTPLRPAKLQCCPIFQPESGMAPYCAPIKPIRQSQ